MSKIEIDDKNITGNEIPTSLQLVDIQKKEISLDSSLVILEENDHIESYNDSHSKNDSTSDNNSHSKSDDDLVIVNTEDIDK